MSTCQGQKLTCLMWALWFYLNGGKDDLVPKVLVWNLDSILHSCLLCRILLCPDKHLSCRTQKAFSYQIPTRLAVRQAGVGCSSPRHWAAACPHSLVFLPWLSCWKGQCHEIHVYSGQLWVERLLLPTDAQQLQDPNHQPLVRQQPWYPKGLVPSRGFQQWWLWKTRTGATTTHEMTGDKQLRLLNQSQPENKVSEYF